MDCDDVAKPPTTIHIADRVLVLIHGTFATDAQWVQDESLLCKRLANNEQVHVHLARFRWSGKNSHRARLSAAKRLQRKLRRIHLKNANAKVLLVAHSHGGNVALYALGDPEIAANVSGLITMGTPYLWSSRRSLEDPARVFLAAAAVTIGVTWIVCLVALTILLGALSERYDPYSEGNFKMVQVAIIVGYLALGAGLMYWNPAPRVVKKIVRLLAKRQGEAMHRLRVPQRIPVPVLRVTVKGDEAEQLLRYSALAGNVPSYLWWAMVTLLSLLIPLTGVMYVAMAFGISEDPSQSQSWFSTASLVLLLFVSCLALSLVIVLFQAALMTVPGAARRIAFGPETSAESCLMHIRPNVDPPGTAFASRTYQYNRQWGVWKHCQIYEKPEIVDEITDWMEDMQCPHPPQFPRSREYRGFFAVMGRWLRRSLR